MGENRGNKMNAQKEMEALLKKFKNKEKKAKLLLHSCCAPCSTYVLNYLSPYFSIIDYFYNPNMSSLAEHEKRSCELERLIQELNKGINKDNGIGFMTSKFQSSQYNEKIKGYEQEPEKGKRCEICFRLRLEEAARMAIEMDCDYFATTLTISPLKNANLINELGNDIGKAYGIKYLASDFKKKNGYLTSIELSHQHQLYRQDYCGCIYSKKERERQDDQEKL